MEQPPNERLGSTPRDWLPAAEYLAMIAGLVLIVGGIVAAVFGVYWSQGLFGTEPMDAAAAIPGVLLVSLGGACLVVPVMIRRNVRIRHDTGAFSRSAVIAMWLYLVVVAAIVIGLVLVGDRA